MTRSRAPYIVAAPGRGGAAWLSKVAHEHSIETTNNEVDIGVRVEVPNSVMDHLTRAPVRGQAGLLLRHL